MTEAVAHGSRRACIDDLSTEFFRDKYVLLRVDFNVPLQSVGEGLRGESQHTWIVGNDAKIRGCIPTINLLLQAKAKVVVISHMGRPPFDVPMEERKHSRYSLHSVMYKLSRYIENTNFYFANDCTGPARQEVQAIMQGGDLLLCENTRFHYELEEHCDPAFAVALAEGIDLMVQEAFSCCHRPHASISGAPNVLDITVLGLQAKRELVELNKCVLNPAHPFAAIIGGAKMSTKLPIVRALLRKVDILVIGGAMAFTFMLAKGLCVGQSLAESSMLAIAADIVNQCENRGIKLVLPCDFLIEHHGEVETAAAIPHDASALDIGPQSVNTIVDALSACETVLWNGPVGRYERPPFDSGTNAIIDWLKARGQSLTSVVCGGDTVAAVEAHLQMTDVHNLTSSHGRCGVTHGTPKRLPHDDYDYDNDTSTTQPFTHLSLAGGAALNLLSTKSLAGVDAVSWLSAIDDDCLTEAAKEEKSGTGSDMPRRGGIGNKQQLACLSPPRVPAEKDG